MCLFHAQKKLFSFPFNNWLCFSSGKSHSENKILEIVEGFACEDKRLGRLRKFRVVFSSVFKKGDLMVLGTAKLRHIKSTMWPTTRGRDVSKEITKEFTIVFYETQYIVIRNSKLAGPSRSASKWISWHRKTIPTVYPEINSTDIKKQWYLTLNKSGQNAPMRLRSDFRAAVTIKNRLHRESGEERAGPIPFQHYQRWHPSSSSDSWWNWDTSKSWWSS